MSLGIYIDKVLKKKGYTIKKKIVFFYLHEGSATRVGKYVKYGRNGMFNYYFIRTRSYCIV